MPREQIHSLVLVALEQVETGQVHLRFQLGDPESILQSDIRGTEEPRLGVVKDLSARVPTAIAAGFERPKGGRASPLARGLRASSHFYAATGEFHLLNTCNTWTARMLRASGIDITPAGIVTADEMVTRLRAAIG